MKRAHVLISGRVQGVFFRSNTRDKARYLRLAGWVRNLSDGRVEAVFEGDEKSVAEMLRWCRHGEPPAQVFSVESEWEEPEGLSGFEVMF